MLRALSALTSLVLAMLLATPSEASACAGLIGSNGAVNLGRTTTLAAYSEGVEHYVTSFEFQGGGGQFGTLIPLPGIPAKVERGGAWTLQRLQLETQLRRLAAGAALSAAPAGEARVVLETRIDALDITVLEGGGPAVATWAQQHGFRLSPDAPEMLDFYAARSPIFLTAVFDGAAAAKRGQQTGDGTPVHLTIPTAQPWVPLRILSLGKQATDLVQADVFLLTDAEPELSPGPRPGFALTHSRPATASLLNDLRSDSGMGWVPQGAWLTKLELNSRAAEVRYDLSVAPDRASAPPPGFTVVLPAEPPERDILPETAAPVQFDPATAIEDRAVPSPLPAERDTADAAARDGVPFSSVVVGAMVLALSGVVHWLRRLSTTATARQ